MENLKVRRSIFDGHDGACVTCDNELIDVCPWPQTKVVGAPRGNGEAVGSPTDSTPTQENPSF